MNTPENPKEEYRFLTLTTRQLYTKIALSDLLREVVPVIVKRSHKISTKWYCGIELSEGGMCHFHWIGLVSDMNSYKLFTRYWVRKYGGVKSVEPKHLTECVEYCLKDKSYVLRQYYNDDSIPYFLSYENYIQFIDCIKKPVFSDEVIRKHEITEYFQKNGLKI